MSENKWNPTEYLSKLHTKVLMNLKQSCYRVNGGGKYNTPEHEMVYNTSGHGNAVNLAQIKAELAKREHIPTKLEAKEIRKRRAKTAQNR